MKYFLKYWCLAVSLSYLILLYVHVLFRNEIDWFMIFVYSLLVIQFLGLHRRIRESFQQTLEDRASVERWMREEQSWDDPSESSIHNWMREGF